MIFKTDKIRSGWIAYSYTTLSWFSHEVLRLEVLDDGGLRWSSSVLANTSYSERDSEPIDPAIVPRNIMGMLKAGHIIRVQGKE